MSLLASTTGRSIARATTLLIPSSTSTSSSGGVTVLLESRRYASRRRAHEKAAKKKTGVQRDAMGNPIAPKKERTPPLFTPLPVDQLQPFPVFEVEARPAPEETKLPIFRKLDQHSVGKAFQFSNDASEARKQLGLPKSVWKEFKLLAKPVSVVRGITLDAVNMLAKVQRESTSSLDTRVVFTGRSGSGKSYLLLQAVEWCLAHGWIVLYIPRAVNLVNSTTPYHYDLRTKTFFQPEAAYQILHRARVANAKTFKGLKTKESLTIAGAAKPIPAGTILYDLLDIPREQLAQAPIILGTLLKELEGHTANPVLLAIDDFQALFNKSLYRDPHFKPISTYHLHTPRLLLDYTSGRRSFTHGAVLGALTSTDPKFPISLELQDQLGAESLSRQPSAPEPYVLRSKILGEYLDGVKSVEVPKSLSVDEAGSVFEVWMKQRMLASKAHDELFMARYVESSGNPRDFVWKGLLSTLST
ncbi:37S ribosomal protein S23, mitochondrial [Leucoagaricus sp. SymC.cos]|nr:37S ribosomal protein S23, mitochondrial [Leucoagaricus sp. SymC.cos]